MFKFAICSGSILSNTFMIPLARMHRFQSRICCLNVEARNGNLKLSCLLYEVSCPIIACCESCPLEAYAVLASTSQPCRRLWSYFASTTPNCRISAWRPFTLSGGISGIVSQRKFWWGRAWWICLMAGRDLADADAQTTPEGEAEQTATILVKAGIQNFHVSHGNSGLNFFKHLGLRSRVKSTARGEICQRQPQFDGLTFLAWIISTVTPTHCLTSASLAV